VTAARRARGAASAAPKRARGSRASERPTVRVERAGAVATVVLDRPDKLNALSPREHLQLQKILASLREDFTTRVVILTGTGRAFSAGADLSNKREDGKPVNDLERRHRARLGDRTVAAIDALDQITICAINGLCVGGGAVLALACDLRVMARDAWLSIPEVAIGMPLTWGALPLLLREIGPSRTIELVMTCERVGAQQALDFGLVNHVVADPVQKAREIAAKIVAQPAVPVAMTKTTVRALRSTVARGDVTAADGDLYWLAIRLGGLRVDGPPKKPKRTRA
jgi:enoyl-CoA hydratase/carnithine racemase